MTFFLGAPLRSLRFQYLKPYSILLREYLVAAEGCSKSSVSAFLFSTFSELMKESFMIIDANIRDVTNSSWSADNVHDQYSNTGPHSDLYRYINQWSDMEMYLNVGYTRWWQRHNTTANHLRLIDRLADFMLDLYDQSPHRDEKWLLDIASGRGGAAIRAFQRYGVRALGIDFTGYNVERATLNARQRGVWPNVRFQIGDAHNLPIRDEAMSLVWSIESPAHFRDKARFLSEVSRILKPGGVFAMTELLVVEAIALASDKNRKIYDEFLKVWDVPYLESYDGYVGAMEDAGLKVVRSEIATKYNLDIYKRYCRWFLWISKIEPLYRSYKRHIRKKIKTNLDHVRDHSFYSYQALNLGMIDYGLFWAVKR